MHFSLFIQMTEQNSRWSIFQCRLFYIILITAQVLPFHTLKLLKCDKKITQISNDIDNSIICYWERQIYDDDVGPIHEIFVTFFKILDINLSLIFRYSGRTQKQLMSFVRENPVVTPAFQR